MGLKGAEAPPAVQAFEAIQREVQSVFERCRHAVVRIEAHDDVGQLSGTGFFIDPNGTLITSYTVGGASRDIVVVCPGDLRYPAKRLVADAHSGIAILKVEAQTAFIPPGASRALGTAAPVMTIGYPMDLPVTPGFGVVAGFDRKYLGRYFATTHIRANVPVQRGEGGAPLLNMQGEAVGVLISSLDQGSALFALPIEAVEKIRRDFVRFGETRPGWIGVDVGPASTPGAEIREVFPNAPAEKAGLQPGDVLQQVGSTVVKEPEDVLDASFFLTAGDEVEVRLNRDHQELRLKVTPGHAPSPRHQALPVLGLGGDAKPGEVPMRLQEPPPTQ